MSYNFDEVINREGTSSIKYDFRKIIFGNDKVIPLWVADMDFRTPDFIISAIRKRLDHEILGYSAKPDRYYESIIHWMQRRHGWNIKKEWISFSPGVVPAMVLSMLAFTEPGDKIIVQPPVYFPFFSSIQEHRRMRVDNPLKVENGRYVMDFDDLLSKIDKGVKMIFLCNPHNPVGRSWRLEELRKLAGVCLENNIIVISDEIHSDIIYSPNRHFPFASLGEEIAKNTITCMAPSKTFNLAGMSASFLVIPDKGKWVEYEKHLKAYHLDMGNVLGLEAMKEGYLKGNEWLESLIRYLQGNIQFIHEYISIKLPMVKMYIPESTYLVWLDFRELGMKQPELNSFLINQAGIGLSDGALFGPGGEGFQRLNIACPRSLLHRALEKLYMAVKDKF